MDKNMRLIKTVLVLIGLGLCYVLCAFWFLSFGGKDRLNIAEEWIKMIHEAEKEFPFKIRNIFIKRLGTRTKWEEATK